MPVLDRQCDLAVLRCGALRGVNLLACDDTTVIAPALTRYPPCQTPIRG
ncbi:MAG: hypothetical protein QOK16_4458 [Solirubrobacteraceae bacterium]|nr:hypothetical protein [Solirubrobacteraceae bacterium]